MKNFFVAYWDVFKGLRARVIAAVVSTGLAGMMEGTALLFLVPILGQGIADTQSGDYGPLPKFVANMMRSIDTGKISLFTAFILAGFLSALMKILAQALSLSVRNRIEERMRQQTGMALFHTDWPYFINQRLGHMGKAIVTETSQAAEGCMTFVQLLGQSLICVFLIIVSLMISPPMTLVTFLFGGLTGVLYYIGGRRALRHAQAWWESTATIAEKISEMFNHLKHLRASGLTPAAIHQTEIDYKNFNRSHFRSIFYKDVLRATLECASIILMAGFLAYGFFLSGEKPQWAIVFLAVFYRLMPRVSAIQDAVYTCGIYSVWLNGIQNRIETLKEHRMRSSAGAPVDTIRRAQAVNLAYQYPNATRRVLNGISITLEKGKAVLLSGESGSGKTTFMDLLLGLIEPTDGEWQINGRNLRELDVEQWRSRIGLVLQGSPVFHGTVLENISFFQTPDEAKAWRCAEMADAADFIRHLPQGIHTPIAEKGGRLSGGQRQRIALARALYRDPWLLILDEPTSELDEESQTRILETLRSLKPNYAMLMSSHRAEAIGLADTVLYLPSGRIENRTPAS